MPASPRYPTGGRSLRRPSAAAGVRRNDRPKRHASIHEPMRASRHRRPPIGQSAVRRSSNRRTESDCFPTFVRPLGQRRSGNRLAWHERRFGIVASTAVWLGHSTSEREADDVSSNIVRQPSPARVRLDTNKQRNLGNRHRHRWQKPMSRQISRKHTKRFAAGNASAHSCERWRANTRRQNQVVCRPTRWRSRSCRSCSAKRSRGRSSKSRLLFSTSRRVGLPIRSCRICRHGC